MAFGKTATLGVPAQFRRGESGQLKVAVQTRIPSVSKLAHYRAFGRLAKLGQFGVIYTQLLGAFTNFAPMVTRSQFVLGKMVARSLDLNAIFEFQEEEGC
jgi:hypothetical protein